MVVVDRYLAMGIAGTILAIIFAAGEFLGWWEQLGEFGFWAAIGLALLGYLLNASRSQGASILQALGGLRATTEQGFREVKDGIGRVEAGIGRVEAGIGRVEGNTAETVQLLREIRDRLPAPR